MVTDVVSTGGEGGEGLVKTLLKILRRLVLFTRWWRGG